jgi:hypothetical protein
MITYNQFRQNKAAFEKAQQQNPVVLRTGNAHVVLGATGIYTVNITADYSVACSCTAGKYDKFCYHAASALLVQLAEEAEAEAVAAKFDEDYVDHELQVAVQDYCATGHGYSDADYQTI